MRKILLTLLLPCLIFGEDFLKMEDVHTLVSTLLERHEKKTLDQTMIQKAYVNFLNTFDPHKIYLLKGEVKKVEAKAKRHAKQHFEEYQSKDYSSFHALFTLAKKAILRSRNLRQSYVFSTEPFQEYDTFAPNEAILAERIAVWHTNYKDAFSEDKENHYLFLHDNGTPFTQKERENCIALYTVKAFAKTLDAHTSFYDEKEALKMRQQLEKSFYGIGLHLTESKGAISILDFIENTPAKECGMLQIGDTLIQIDDWHVQGQSLAETLEHLHRPYPKTVRLQFERHGSPFWVTLDKTLIATEDGRVSCISIPCKAGTIGIISVPSFYRGAGGISTAEDLKKCVLELKSQGRLRGIIIDLRNNSGGFLSQAVESTGLFISSGVVVISKYNDGKTRYFRDIDGKTLFDGPIIVLTSAMTASAAEIFAGTLQDYGIALIVGDPTTYGKGSIQSQTITQGHEDGSYFKVTIGKYYTVSGKSPEKRGVLADISVPGPYFQRKSSESAIDSIDAAFEDPLIDIHPGLKSWFVRYYLPQAQNKRTHWKKHITRLKALSYKRLKRHSLPLSPEAQMQETIHILQNALILL